MSRDASITLDWADGVHHFRLAWGELAKLQEACNCGPYVVLNRILDMSWRIEDISNVIRLGLIGGGMAPVEALQKVRSWVEDRPPMENLTTARVILMAALMGAPEEAVKKKRKPQESDFPTSPTGKSGSHTSTATEP
jgi:hypothetical protein